MSIKGTPKCSPLEDLTASAAPTPFWIPIVALTCECKRRRGLIDALPLAMKRLSLQASLTFQSTIGHQTIVMFKSHLPSKQDTRLLLVSHGAVMVTDTAAIEILQSSRELPCYCNRTPSTETIDMPQSHTAYLKRGKYDPST